MVVNCTAQRIAIAFAFAFASARSRTVWRVYAKFHIEMSEGGAREKRAREIANAMHSNRSRKLNDVHKILHSLE